MKLYAYRSTIANRPAWLRQTLLVMRITTLILFSALLQVSAAGFGQKVTIVKNNIALSEVFKEIRMQTGFNVLWQPAQVDGSKTISLQIKNQNLDAALAQILNGRGLEYRIEEETVMIKPKEPSFLDRVTSYFVSIDVRGRVVDEKGKPMSGATVKIKGTNRAVITNGEGVFTFSGIEENAVLEISYLGYKVKEVKAAKDMGDVKMEVASGELEEVSVYSDGFQKIPKERATGAFVLIDNETLNKQVSSDILTRLEGTVPGLLFKASNKRLGSSTDISLRGRATFSSTAPLIILDNFPYNGDLDNLNPNDIESVTLLKDAAAASIWGARAGNGVIVITSKKGRNNAKAQITFNTNATITQEQDLMSEPLMSVRDFVDLERLNFARGRYRSLETSYLKQSLSPVVDLLIAKRDGLLSAEEAESQINSLANRSHIANDYMKYVFQEPVMQRHNLSISGGGNQYSYYVSAGYDRSRGTIIGTNSDRKTISFKNSFTPIKGLVIDASGILGKGNAWGANRVGDLGYGYAFPYESLVDKDGLPASIIHGGTSNVDIRPSAKAEAEAKGLLNWDYRPLDELKLLGDKELSSGNNINYILGTNVSYSLLQMFNITFAYQLQEENSQSFVRNTTESFYFRDLYNRFTQIDASNKLSYPIPYGDIVDRASSIDRTNHLRGQFTFDHTLSEEHSLTVLLGAEMSDQSSRSNSDIQYGFSEQGLTIMPVDYITLFPQYISGNLSQIPFNATRYEATNRFLSFYGNASYAFDRKYVFSASARKDGANLFGVNTNQKWKPLWSAGFKWNIGKEGFWTVDWLPEFQVRATYGYAGSIGASTAYMTANYTTPSSITGLPNALIQSPANPDLKWEEQNTVNVGIDFATKERRISGNIDIYRKYGSDLIIDAPFDPTSGFANSPLYSAARNYGDMMSKGIDFNVHSINTLGTVKWETNVNISYSRNKIKKVAEDAVLSSYLNGNSRLLNEGYPMLYSYKWGGLSPIDGSPIGFVNGIPTNDYSAITSKSKPEDLIKHGTSDPVIHGQLRNTVSFNSFSLDIALLYKLGHHFRRDSYGYLNNYHSDYSLRWQQRGDEIKTYVPALPPSISLYTQFYQNSEVLVERADFLRIQYINLNYSFSKLGFLSKSFRDFQVYVNSSNLGLLWKANKQNLDPESPQKRFPISFSFGIRAALN